MHYEDGTKYEYSTIKYLIFRTPVGLVAPILFQKVVNIGWLDRNFESNTDDKIDDDFLLRCKFLCAHPVNRTRGFHNCSLSLCRFKKPGTLGNTSIYFGSQDVNLGSAEIWVPAKRILYIAPDLICHYIEDHRYMPPAEFVDAVNSFAKRYQ